MINTVTSQAIEILVVDDDQDVREILAETLTEFGYRVSQAISGDAALEVLSRNDAIDMMITDVRMPGMSGLELVELARQARGTLKIILMSGYFVPQAIGQRFLKKPFHMHELACAIRAELG